MDAVIILALKEIQLECYKQIAVEQRGGRAIAEDVLAPYPEKADYTSDIALEGYTLDQLVADAKDKNPQIDIEEVIQNATPQQNTDDQQAQRSAKGVGVKIKAYFEALRDWHYEKREKEYEYQCSKQQTYDRTYGFEYIAKYIDTLLDKWQRESDNGTQNTPAI